MLSIISSIADGKNKMHYIVVDGMDTSFSDTNVEIGSITHPDDLQEDLDNFAKFKAGEIDGYSMVKIDSKTLFKEEYSITTASGEVKWVFEQGQGIYAENGEVEALEGLIIDITDRKKREDEILFLNYHDVLTGLYNRRFFEEETNRVECQLPLSIIVGDINGLKLINDALGHAEGNPLSLLDNIFTTLLSYYYNTYSVEVEVSILAACQTN